MLRKSSNEQDFQKISALVGVNYFTDSTTEAGYSYDYKIQAVDFYSNIGKPSNSVTITRYLTLPQPPPVISLQNANPGVLIHWGKVLQDGIVKYNIYRYNDHNQLKKISEVNQEENQFIDLEVLKSRTYTYSISSVDEYGVEGRLSDIVIINYN